MIRFRLILQLRPALWGPTFQPATNLAFVLWFWSRQQGFFYWYLDLHAIADSGLGQDCWHLIKLLIFNATWTPAITMFQTSYGFYICMAELSQQSCTYSCVPPENNTRQELPYWVLQFYKKWKLIQSSLKSQLQIIQLGSYSYFQLLGGHKG